jgi:transcriptional regulator with XRE-family HTH domain
MLKDRLKQVRNSLPGKITQEKFAQMLGTTRSAIATYETGVVVPKDQFLKLISKEFNINEAWLHDGKGDMYVLRNEDSIHEISERYGLPADCQLLIEHFMELSLPFKKLLLSVAKDLQAIQRQVLYLNSSAVKLSDADKKDIRQELSNLEKMLVEKKRAGSL